MNTDTEQYEPGPAMTARVDRTAETATGKWTLILVRELRHAPQRVWQALTDPVHLREWAPFEADGNLDAVGAAVKLTWVGTGNVSQAKVTRADAPTVLEFGDIRWELEPVDSADALRGGTRLKLWHKIDRRFIAWGAAGWQICFDVLDRLLAGQPLQRIAGPEAMKLGGWQRLVAEYTRQFAAEAPKVATPNSPPKPAPTS
jgi:uncharacterized protein YndB with AHSA1/START domain